MDDQPNITKNSRLQLEVFIRPGREVNVDITCMIDGYCFDLIAWGWGVFYKDHGKCYCEECRQNNQGFKPFDKVEDLYTDHFSDALNVIKNYHAGSKMWVYSELGTAVEACSHRNTDRKYGRS